MSKICAIVVTYNTDISFMNNFNSIKKQVDKIIIVDNASKEETRETLKKIKENNDKKVEVIWNKNNLGLDKAQNQGISKALNENYEWILLLDDDSTLSENMVNKMLEAYKNNKSDKIGIIAPNIIDKNSDKVQKYLFAEGFFKLKRRSLKEKYSDKIIMVIASGSMIKSDLIKKVGLMQEGLFIDSIDTEFALRVRANKYRIMVVRDALLYHSLGKTSTKKIGNIRIYPTNHSIFRQYYILKNRILVWKKYYKIFPNYIIYEIFATIYHVLKIVLFEDKKIQKVRNIFKGIKHGLKGNLRKLS